MQEFDEILLRFGLTKLKTGLDLQLNKFGDIAVTRDGDCSSEMQQLMECLDLLSVGGRVSQRYENCSSRW